MRDDHRRTHYIIVLLFVHNSNLFYTMVSPSSIAESSTSLLMWAVSESIIERWTVIVCVCNAALTSSLDRANRSLCTSSVSWILTILHLLPLASYRSRKLSLGSSFGATSWGRWGRACFLFQRLVVGCRRRWSCIEILNDGIKPSGHEKLLLQSCSRSTWNTSVLDCDVGAK